MIEKKVSSGDLAKIIFFILLLIPFSLIIWGIVPCLLLLIGFFLAKRDGKEDTLKKSISYCWYYVYLTISVLTIGTIFIGIANDYSLISWLENCIPPFLGLLLLCLIFISIFKFLYINPILKNSKIILKNTSNKKSSIENKNNFSISFADEISKLNTLKENGVISDEDFKIMKDNIINNNK